MLQIVDAVAKNDRDTTEVRFCIAFNGPPQVFSGLLGTIFEVQGMRTWYRI